MGRDYWHLSMGRERYRSRSFRDQKRVWIPLPPACSAQLRNKVGNEIGILRSKTTTRPPASNPTAKRRARAQKTRPRSRPQQLRLQSAWTRLVGATRRSTRGRQLKPQRQERVWRGKPKAIRHLRAWPWAERTSCSGMVTIPTTTLAISSPAPPRNPKIRAPPSSLHW